MQPLNVATPATARSGLAFVHDRRAPAGVVIVSDTRLAFVVTVAPIASRTVTIGCVANAARARALLGCLVNAKCVAGNAGVTGTETAAIPTIGRLSLMLPVEPKNRASPNEKIPPSDATNQ